MLIIALIAFLAGLLLDLLGRPNFGLPAQIIGCLLFTVLLVSEPLVAIAFAAYGVYALVKVLR